MGPRINKTVVFRHFEISANSEFVNCKVCRHKLKKNRMHNLKMHLVKMHGIYVSYKEPWGNDEVPVKDELMFAVKQELRGDETVSEDSASAPELSRPASRVPLVKELLPRKTQTQAFRVDGLTKEQLFRSYVGLVTEDGVPLDVLDSENMRNIMEPLARGLSEKLGTKLRLNSTSCETAVLSVAASIRDAVHEELEQHLLSLSVHSALRQPRDLVCVRAQYIKNNTITSLILGLVELGPQPPALNLDSEIVDLLHKYNLNMDQIVAITLDGTTSSLSPAGLDTSEDLNHSYLQNIERFEISYPMQLNEIPSGRCVSYIAQLCALDVIRHDPCSSGLVINCRNLVKFLRENPDIIELQGLSVPRLDSTSRWGSTYNMLFDVLKAKQVLKNVEPIVNKSEEENFGLSEDFWQFISNYCHIFEPLQKTILKFQEEELHYGDFFAQWLKCKLMTQKLVQSSSVCKKESFLHNMGNQLLHCIEHRTAELMTNPSLNACLYLDPRFSHTLSAEKKQAAIDFLKNLYDKIKASGMLIPQKPDTADTTSAKDPIEAMEDENEYLNEYLSFSYDPESKGDADVYSKIETCKLPFQRVETNVLDFWQERKFSDPELYALATVCFAIPATQVNNNQDFASLHSMLVGNQSYVNLDTLENILLVKHNPKYLDKAIQEWPIFEDPK